MYGCRADFSYSLKCMFKDHPLKLIVIVYGLSALLLAYALYLAERPLRVEEGGHSQHQAATDFPDALWLIFMTATTVGYGDYFPKTPLGRIIIMLVAIWGTLVVSVMVVVVGNTLSMQKTETKTFHMLNKLEMRQEMEVKAARFIGYFLLSKSRKAKTGVQRRHYHSQLHKSEKQFKEIRKKIQDNV